MGILDTLGQVNEDWKDAAGSVVDNDAFSIQNTVRGGIEAATGMGEDGTEDFAEDSARTFKNINRDIIAAPGRWVGQQTTGDDGTNALSGVVEGGEATYEVLLEDVGAVTYGTVTGANVRTNDPTHASDDFRPGVLETLDLIPAAKAGTTATKVGAKGAKASMSFIDDGATALSRLVRRGGDDAARKADDTVRATDDTVQTRLSQNPAYKHTPSKTPETVDAPDYLKFDALTGSLSKVKNAPTSYKAVGALGLGVGAVGLAGAPPFPRGYERDKTYDTAPGGVRVKETDNSGTVLGWWVVLNTEEGVHTSLNASGRSTSTVDFPTNSPPPFSSPEQADTAFTRYADQYQDPEQSGATVDDSGQPTNKNGAWGEADVLKPLQYGFVLVEQEHNTKEKYRYAVIARAQNGRLIFINSSGEAVYTPETFGTQEKAMDKYNGWLETGRGVRPDPSQDRPSMSDVVAALSNTGTSLGGIGGLVVGAGLGLVALLLILRFVL